MLSFKQHGVAGRAGAMRDIAPSTLPHVFPRQSRRRFTPRFCATGASGESTVYNMRWCAPEDDADVLFHTRRRRSNG